LYLYLSLTQRGREGIGGTTKQSRQRAVGRDDEVKERRIRERERGGDRERERERVRRFSPMATAYPT